MLNLVTNILTIRVIHTCMYNSYSPSLSLFYYTVILCHIISGHNRQQWMVQILFRKFKLFTYTCMMNCVTVRSARHFRKGIISQFRNDLLMLSASSVTCAYSVCDLCKVSKVLSYRTTLGFQYCSFATPRPCYLSNTVKPYGRVFNQSVVFFCNV